MGSAYAADGIWHPHRQIRPFFRTGGLLRANGRGAQGRRADPTRPRPSPEKAAVVCRQYEGGERRLDVVEFVAIDRALGADPLKLMARFVGGAKDKPARPKKLP
jgi:hypothetical protein